MPRYKPWREKPLVKAKWSLEDKKNLLAQLDFIVETVVQEKGLIDKSNILSLLQKRFGQKRSQNQIKAILLQTWSKTRDSDTDLKRVFEEVYQSGTGCMKHLDGNLKQMVKEELKSIKLKEEYIYVSSPRTLRSASQNHGLKPKCVTPNRDISADCTSSTGRRTRQHQLVELPETEQMEDDAHPEENASSENAIIVRHPRTSSRMPTESPESPEASIANTLNEMENSPSPCIRIEKSYYQTSSLDENKNQQNASKYLVFRSPTSNKRTMNYDDANSISNMSTLQDFFGDVKHFRDRMLKSETECKRLNQSLSQTYSVISPAQGSINERMINEINFLSKKNANLKNRLTNQTYFQSFSNPNEGGRMPTNCNEIGSQWNKMTRSLRSLSNLHNFRRPGRFRSDCSAKDAVELKDRVFGNNLQPLANQKAIFKVGQVIQSMTGAAVCEWVFSREFRCVAMMTTPLLEEYRSRLRALCGESALHNLDFMAHDSMINSPHFEDVVFPRAAAKLADQLFETLKEVLINEELEKAKSRVRSHCNQIFKLALKIYSSGMISDKIFEFIWPAHDEIFNSHCMEEQEPEKDMDDRLIFSRKAKTISLVLVPGFRFYNYDRELVDYRAFTTGDEEGLGEPTLLAKAVVETYN